MSIHPPTAPRQLDVTKPKASPPILSQVQDLEATVRTSNGSPPTLIERPAILEPLDDESSPMEQRSRRSWTATVVVLGILIGLAIVGGGAWYTLTALEDDHKDLDIRPAERGKVILSIVEKGELEAAKNTDVICKVRSKSQASSIASSIKWLVDNGAKVKKGDVIIQLDDAGLKDQVKTQEIVLTEKRASLIDAEKEKEITESQNRSDLQTAENNVKLAEIDFEKYQKGDLEQKRKDIMGRTTLAESDLLQWKDRAAWAFRMRKKGYISPSQAQSDEAKMHKAEIDLDKVKEEKRVLDFFEQQRTLLDLENKLAQAKEALTVTRIQTKGREAKAEANLQAKLSVLSQEQSKLMELEEDVRNCNIRSPNDGMVVYYVPESTRWGMGSQQGMIALGESVREGQKLMRIPDLKQMQVKVKIHEAIVSRIEADRTRETGFCDAVHAGLAASLTAYNAVAALLPGTEYRVWFSDYAEEIASYGLPAEVQIPSLAKPLPGHVKLVSPVASQTDFMSSDVRVYETMVLIDGFMEGLKPAMSAEVTILVDERDNVLRLPVHAVLDVDGKKFCYMKNDEGKLEKRSLLTGLNNNRFIEILDGSELKEGDLVVQNPRTLAEKAGDLHVEHKTPGENLKGKGRRNDGNGKGSTPAGDVTAPAAAPVGKPVPGAVAPGGPQGLGKDGQGKGDGRAKMSPEDQQKRQQQGMEFMDRIRKAKPADRKAMLDQAMDSFGVPPQGREEARKRFKGMLKQQGIEIPD